MTKAAFDKIKAGIDDVRCYLDGSVDKVEFQVPALTDSKVSPASAQAQAQALPPEEAP
jgi:hypothetical protein